MRFYEHEAKALLRKQGIPLPKSGLAKTGADAQRIAGDIGGPVVLKSQVLSGGRMKAGAIKFADNPQDAAKATEEILKIQVGGQLPVGVLVEQRAKTKKEYYIGVTYDALARRPLLIISDMGGIDIEEVATSHPQHIARRHLSSLLPFSDYQAKETVASLGISGNQLTRITPIVVRLVRMMQQYNLTLAEINPLVELEDGNFMVLDAHADLEDEAKDRYPELLKEFGIGKDETRQGRPQTPFEIRGNQVDAGDPRGIAGHVVEFDGDLGLIIGAGGGSLVLLDAVRKHGGRAANYCEIGGNPSVRKAAELMKLILSKPGVKKVAVMMNVVSNTRVDIVARGVVKGVLESGKDPKDVIAIFRIPGAWEGEGFKLLQKYGVEFVDRTVSMDEAARRAVAKVGGR